MGWALESKLSFIEGRSCKEASWLLPCPIPVHALTSSKFQILHGSQSIETFSFSPCVKVWSWRNGSFLKYIKQFQINSKWRRICSAKKPHKNWVDMQAYSYRIKIMYPYYTPQSMSQQNDQLHTVIQLKKSTCARQNIICHWQHRVVASFVSLVFNFGPRRQFAGSSGPWATNNRNVILLMEA